ncbi:MAG: methylated-DNA--[protein]-cysteine S-methyltransferase [Candidatus Nanohaloarchaea archaeon]
MKLEAFGTVVELDHRLVENPEKVRRQLEEYLAGDRKDFQLHYRLPGGFTGAVLEKIDGIPYGETRSYGEIASKLDTAAVAVGQAAGRNPLPLLVPCHRVVGKASLGGYGYGTGLKKKLLRLEGTL